VINDNTPMRACDILYGVRAKLNSAKKWVQGAFTTKAVVTEQQARDERGRFLPCKTNVTEQHCLLGAIGKVAHDDGTSEGWKASEPARNAGRLLALAINPDADEVYALALDTAINVYRFDPEHAQRSAWEDAYGRTVFMFNDDHRTNHTAVTKAIDDALAICLDEAK
jgi:hypothetical protein